LYQQAAQEFAVNSDPIISAWLVWFVAGIGLALLELLIPAFVIVFFGLGCWVVAGALQIWHLTLAQQVLLFIVASIFSIVLLRKWLMKIFRGKLTDGSETGFDDFPQGMHVTVTQRITPDVNGRIQFRGTHWDAAADEAIEKDETVEIIRFAGDSHRVFFVKKI
jgi:membrane protein implicated in regulation of membrane protease activity